MQPFTFTQNGATRTVFAPDKDTAYAMLVGRDVLSIKAIDAHDDAEFRDLWPTDVRLAIAKAVNTLDPIPAYAVKQVTWALKVAARIEAEANRDLEQGAVVLSRLPLAERSKVGV